MKVGNRELVKAGIALLMGVALAFSVTPIFVSGLITRAKSWPSSQGGYSISTFTFCVWTAMIVIGLVCSNSLDRNRVKLWGIAGVVTAVQISLTLVLWFFGYTRASELGNYAGFVLFLMAFIVGFLAQNFAGILQTGLVILMAGLTQLVLLAFVFWVIRV
jgi:hypothetical protein